MDNNQTLRRGITPILATDQSHRQLTTSRWTCLRQGGSRLYVNQRLYNEENTLFLHYQPDGDICIYQRLPDDSAGAQHWCAGVDNDEPDYMELSNSGHFQLVDKLNYAYFKSKLTTNTGYIVLQNDGNFVMYDEFWGVYWACGGGGPFDSVFNGLEYVPPSLCPFSSEITNTNECRTPPYPSPPSTSSHGTSYMVAKNIPYIVAGVVALALIAMAAYWYHPKRTSSRMVYVSGPDPVMASTTVELGSVVNTEDDGGQMQQPDK